MQFTKDEKKSYISILADGKFHEGVEKGVEDAVLREYETSDGKTGSKWELVYTKIQAKIMGIEFQDGEYGTNIQLALSGEERDVVVSVGVSSNFGEDLMKKLPNVNLSEPVELAPYSFVDERGKSKKGVTIYQNGEKLASFFSEQKDEKWVAVNGYPTPDGDVEDYKSDDWKLFYLQARKFLVSYIKNKIVPKFDESPEAKDIAEFDALPTTKNNSLNTTRLEPPTFLKNRTKSKEELEEGINSDEVPF